MKVKIRVEKAPFFCGSMDISFSSYNLWKFPKHIEYLASVRFWNSSELVKNGKVVSGYYLWSLLKSLLFCKMVSDIGGFQDTMSWHPEYSHCILSKMSFDANVSLWSTDADTLTWVWHNTDTSKRQNPENCTSTLQESVSEVLRTCVRLDTTPDTLPS